MSPKRKPNEAWKLWQRSQCALNDLTDLMQQIATVVS
jgi:hypothetical protein